MKTDKFDEAIRRKLESIEPAFRERDWGHMQSFMHRHGYPPAWTGAAQWFMPLAAAAAVTGVLLSTIWQFRTNQELRQSIQTLSQTVARLETTQAKLIQNQTKTDTVYVTTFTQPNAPGAASPFTNTPPVLAHNPANRTTGTQPANTLPVGDPVAANGGSQTQSAASVGASRSDPLPTRQPADRALADNSPAANASSAADPDKTGTPAMATAESKPARSSRPGNGRLPLRNPAISTESSGDDLGIITVPITINAVTDRSGQRIAGQRLARQQAVGQRFGAQRLAGTQNTDRGAGSSQTPPVDPGKRSENQRSEQLPALAITDNTERAAREATTLPLLTGRPLQLDSAAFGEAIARRIRRIRSLFPVTPATTVAPTPAMPTETANSRPLPGGIRFRVGVTGEFGTVQTVAGLYSEVLIGRHWALGVGLNRAVIQGGTFATDEQFDDRTNIDFRKQYAPGIDPHHDILDIKRQLTVWQLPISLSYRLPLSQGFAVVPSVGVNVAVSAQDDITFMYRRGPREFYNATVPPLSPPSGLFTNYTVAAGIEKSWRHLVFQAGPVLTTPAKKLPDPVNPVSLGMRARILFQF